MVSNAAEMSELMPVIKQRPKTEVQSLKDNTRKIKDKIKDDLGDK